MQVWGRSAVRGWLSVAVRVAVCRYPICAKARALAIICAPSDITRFFDGSVLCTSMSAALCSPPLVVQRLGESLQSRHAAMFG